MVNLPFVATGVEESDEVVRNLEAIVIDNDDSKVLLVTRSGHTQTSNITGR